MARGLIFISNVTKAMEHEWFVEAVDKKELALEFILFNSKGSDLYNFIRQHGFKCSNYSLPSKLYVPLYSVFFTLRFLFKRYDFVHCHLFEASLIGIISSKLAGIKKRIHTRHHGDFHHVYFPGAIKYDLLVNRLSTHIIAVSSNIKTILEEKEQVPSGKITVIPHGIPSSLMGITVPEKEISTIRQKYSLENKAPVIGVISRFVEWKGIQYIIPAFKQVLQDFPNAKLVLANANGDYEDKLALLLKELPPPSFVTIPFENNINALFQSFNVFVHTPVDSLCEAFGQVYIEALSLGIPMVCTLSGIACELVEDERNALVAKYKDTSSVYQGITKLLTNDNLRNSIISQGKLDVKEYTFEKKYAKIKTIYLN